MRSLCFHRLCSRINHKAKIRRLENQHKKLLPDVKPISRPSWTWLETSEQNPSNEFPKAYDSTFFSNEIYALWEQSDCFKPNVKKNGLSPFSMVLPPPNVTGSLHLGHALTVAIEDAIIRHKRMLGHSVNYIPGADHAGIATQVKVEKRLAVKGHTRFTLGREVFAEELSNWRKEHQKRIESQLRRMGASLNWDQFAFTLDDKFSRAVTEAFCRLHSTGLISQKKVFINWSPSLQSVISDIEVNYTPVGGANQTKLNLPGYEKPVRGFGLHYTIKYHLVDSNNELKCIEVMTTRPETMFGDVAIAVHPNDIRYSSVIGKTVINPSNNKHLPIIGDELVDPEFGTGAVKVTPAHDPLDYDIGESHNLECIKVIDDEGNLTVGEFIGLPRFTVRRLLINKLDQTGHLVSSESLPHSIPVCSRSGDVIESKLMAQWFLDCKEMADKVLASFDKLNVVPSSAASRLTTWLKNVQPWCISRQLWWGHKIPLYKVTIDGQELVGKHCWIHGRSFADAHEEASILYNMPVEDIQLEQSSDVLDTWFSSALYPFAVHGWPDLTSSDYPLSIMETGNDILHFWVSRMLMLGLELTNELPFRNILLHGIIQDRQGRKMSKSLGNTIDPLHVIDGCSLEQLQSEISSSLLDSKEKKFAESVLLKQFPKGIPKCGADALRFSLLRHDASAGVIKFSVDDVIYSSAFCNKIFQSFRFFRPHFTDSVKDVDFRFLRAMDAWILEKLMELMFSANQGFGVLKLHQVCIELYTFWVNDFCNTYLEYGKMLPNSEIANFHSVSFYCFTNFLKLLHPFMPFLTEGLWQFLPCKSSALLINAQYPIGFCLPVDTKILINSADNLVALSRKIRAEYNPSVCKKSELYVSGIDVTNRFEAELLFKSITRTKSVVFVDEMVHNVDEKVSLTINGQMFTIGFKRIS